jgi:hypothetical protein
MFFVNNNEYIERLNICKSCENFHSKFKVCNKCGCFMPAKCKLSKSKCPKNFWTESTSNIEVEPNDINIAN